MSEKKKKTVVAGNKKPKQTKKPKTPKLPTPVIRHD